MLSERTSRGAYVVYNINLRIEQCACHTISLLSETLSRGTIQAQGRAGSSSMD